MWVIVGCVAANAAPASAQEREVVVHPSVTTNNEALDELGSVVVPAVVGAFNSLGYVASSSNAPLVAAVAQCAELASAECEGDCPTMEACISGALQANDGAYAATVTIYALAGQSAPHTVAVAMYDREGGLTAGRVEVGEGSVEDAGRRAVAQLVAQARGETSSDVRVSGTPVGAGVSIDGSAAGQVPTTVRLDNGPHRITVSQDGYRSETRNVTVNGDTTLEFSLERASGDGEEPGGGGARRGVGIALAAVGLASGVGQVVAHLALSGCEERVGDGCLDKEVPLGLAIGWGVASAVLVGAGLVLWLGAGDDEPEATGVSRVGFGFGQLSLEGRF